MKRKIFVIFIILLTIFTVYFSFHHVENVLLNNEDITYNQKIISNINTIKIQNSNIKKHYKFVFLSDLHASIIDENEEDETIRNSLVERKKLFTNENQNKVSSEKIFPEIIKYTNNINADALLLGGDIIDSPADSNFKFLGDNLKKLKANYLYTLGNHDWTFGWDYQTKETEEKYYPKFKEFMSDTDVTYLEYEDLIVLSINNGKTKIEESAISKVKEVLEKKKPTLVMMHVPLATQNIANEEKTRRDRVTVLGEYGRTPDSTTQEVINMILSEEYNVFYVIAGHIHLEAKDELNERIYEQVTAPAYKGNINLIEINK